MKDFFWDECPQGWMLKTPPPKSLDLHSSVIKCKFWTYDDNIGPKIKHLGLFLGLF